MIETFFEICGSPNTFTYSSLVFTIPAHPYARERFPATSGTGTA